MDVAKILEEYAGRSKKVTIGVLGGHSALDICQGATKLGFDTVVVCQKGREKTYEKYYRRRDGYDGEKGCVGNVILVDKFENILDESVQEELRALNTVFVHNRYFWVYFSDFEKVEKEFRVPIFGIREGVKLEERDVEKNQYYLLEKAGIRIPRMFEKPEEIDCLAIVKVNEAERGYERAFFFADSAESFREEGGKRVESGLITQEALDNAVIEEYIVGAHVNLNYFHQLFSL